MQKCFILLRDDTLTCLSVSELVQKIPLPKLGFIQKLYFLFISSQIFQTCGFQPGSLLFPEMYDGVIILGRQTTAADTNLLCKSSPPEQQRYDFLYKQSFFKINSIFGVFLTSFGTSIYQDKQNSSPENAWVLRSPQPRVKCN